MTTNMIKPYPGMVIKENITLLPGVYNFFEKEGITVGSDNITIDGNGAVIIGGKHKSTKTEVTNKEEFDYAYSENKKDDSLGYNGIGVKFIKRNNVIIKNIVIKNFEIGLLLDQSNNIEIYDNDFSYNYHNPKHGWDDHEDLGGIVLDNSHNCIIKNNKATDVWSALTLKYSDKNEVSNNNFSHTSNVGLRLWRSCNNKFNDNDFSWGIRKEPFEVHARDSSCVLIETGSNDNEFIKNDMRFGGDGLFIRSLNGWMSTGNIFIENDTSFANNNAIEAWDEGNVFIRNKVNFSSYGLWLGNSDNTVLVENEIAYNGVNFKNAPEAFGNAGIAVVNGSGTNFVVEKNHIHHNSGPGIALRYKADYLTNNFLIKDNIIHSNTDDDRGYKGYGIYLKSAKGINLVNNKIYDNDSENVYFGDFTGDITVINNDSEKDIKIELKCSHDIFTTEEDYNFEIIDNGGNENIKYKIQFSDGEIFIDKKCQRKFETAGLYSITAYVYNGENINFVHKNLFVCPNGKDVITNNYIDDFEISEDNNNCRIYNYSNGVTERGAFAFESFSSKNVSILYPKNKNLNMDISDQTHFTISVKYYNEILQYSDNKHPIFRLCKDGENYLQYSPKENFIGIKHVEKNENKYEFMYVEIPLEGDDNYSLTKNGAIELDEINYIQVLIDNPRKTPILFIFDAVTFINKNSKNSDNILETYLDENFNNITTSSITENEYVSKLEPLKNKFYTGDTTKRFVTGVDEGTETYEVDFGCLRKLDTIYIQLYQNNMPTNNSLFEFLPERMVIQYFENGKYVDYIDIKVCKCNNTIKNNPITTDKIRLVLEGKNKPFSILSLKAYYSQGYDNCMKITSNIKRNVSIKDFVVKLNSSVSTEKGILDNLNFKIVCYDENVLDGKVLLEKSIIPEEINFNAETIIHTDNKLNDLDIDKNYAITVTQNELANGIYNGNYYRWVGGGFAKMDGTYGYINDKEIVDDKVGWGRNYFLVSTDTIPIDYTNYSEGLGNRFGIKDNMQVMYQKFNLNDPLKNVLRASISSLTKVTVEDEIITINTSKIEKAKMLIFCDSNKDIDIVAKSDSENLIVTKKENVFEIRLEGKIKIIDLHINGRGVLNYISIEK